MKSLKAIRKRIGSVKGTQKITKAMKLVAAAKLRRAQMAALSARHYSREILAMAGRISDRSGPQAHPLLCALVRNESFAKERQGTQKASELIVLTSDRGLCGAFNGNLLRRVGDFIAKAKGDGWKISIHLIGKKGRDYFRSKAWGSDKREQGIYNRLDRNFVSELAKKTIEKFLRGQVQEVWIAYNRFKSTLVQEVVFEKIVPLVLFPKIGGWKIDYIYEASQGEVLGELLEEALTSQIHQGFLESMASELAARMTAMDNATNNADDMISYLTLQYNRARQAAITKELMDIVNGAEALRR